jgi:predicted ATP-grasp superfamily ATP-dependent carboligase
MKRNSPNPGRAERGWPPVVVAGAFYTGMNLMRGLARRGVDVRCFDCDRGEPGFRTRYGKTCECPNPDDDPGGWLEFMTGLAREIGRKPVLISSADRYVSAMAAHADELAEHYVFHRDAVGLQASFATKECQYALAAENGMAVPRTGPIRSLGDLEAFAAEAVFPCLLKPLHFREWEAAPADHPLYRKKLVTADGPEELIASYMTAAEINPCVVAQEVIDGPDTAKFVYLSCYGRGGDRLGACVVREIRTGPFGFGSASVVEPVADPEVDELCDRFLRRIGYVGLCEIELKRDRRDGRLRMIETNPRYSGTGDAAQYAGVDLGWLHYLELAGRDVRPVTPNGRDFRHIALLRDFETIQSYRRAGLESWGSILRSYRPPVAFYDFDVRDWRVSTDTLVGLARIVAGPTLRKLFPKRRATGQAGRSPRPALTAGSLR